MNVFITDHFNNNTCVRPEMNIEVIVGAEGLAAVTTLPWSKNFQFHFV